MKQCSEINNIKHEKDGLYLEMALFLFQHGHNAYDGKTHFNEYLKYRMSALFSPHIIQTIFITYV
jgi:hypothetical protein